MKHMYLQADTLDICVTYEEQSSVNTCYSNTICDQIILLDDCSFTRSGSTGVIDQSLNIFPNPFTDNIVVNLEDAVERMKSVAIYSLSSQVVMESKDLPNILNLELDLTRQYYSPGIYILQVELTNGLLLHHKIIKL